MKKTYIAPNAVAIKIETVGMMAASLQGRLDSTQNITTSDGFGAHDGDADWEDDEEF